MGSGFGNIFKINTWGESHGKALGVVIDGVPAGLSLSEEDIQPFLDRRAPGKGEFATKRKEADHAEILSGVFEGRTTGTPISVIVHNTDAHSSDYDNVRDNYRPGHADYTFDAKYGFRDYRGGGRSSGRETIGRVIGGAVAGKIMESLGIRAMAYTKSIGPVSCAEIGDPGSIDIVSVLSDPLFMPDSGSSERASQYLKEVKSNMDSAGGVIECVVTGMIPGLGDPVFDKLDANLAKAIMSIGSVKAVEIGAGFAVSRSLGSENNDSFIMRDGHIEKQTNNSGGILGGISDGSDIILRAAIKPTPSIGKPQDTVSRFGENIEMVVKGRHDPIIVPRAVVVVESMVNLVIADMLLSNMSAKMDNLLKIYKNS